MIDQEDYLINQKEDACEINLIQHKTHLITKEKINNTEYEYKLIRELNEKKINNIQENYKDLSIKFIDLINLLITSNTEQKNIFILCFSENKKIYLHFTSENLDMIYLKEEFNEYIKGLTNTILNNNKNYHIFEISQNTLKEDIENIINKLANNTKIESQKLLKEGMESNSMQKNLSNTKNSYIENSYNEKETNIDKECIEMIKQKKITTMQESSFNHSVKNYNDTIATKDEEKIKNSAITQNSFFNENSLSDHNKEISDLKQDSLLLKKDYANKETSNDSNETKKLKAITPKQKSYIKQSFDYKPSNEEKKLTTIIATNKNKETISINPSILIANQSAQNINKLKKQNIKHIDTQKLKQIKINTSKRETQNHNEKQNKIELKKNKSLIQTLFKKLKTIHKIIHPTEEKTQNQISKKKQLQATTKTNLNKKKNYYSANRKKKFFRLFFKFI